MNQVAKNYRKTKIMIKENLKGSFNIRINRDNHVIQVFLDHPIDIDAFAKAIRELPKMHEALQEAKTIIYNLKNGLEKRSETELQAIFDTVIKKATE